MKSLLIAAACSFLANEISGQPVLSHVYTIQIPVAWVKVNETDLKYLYLDRDTLQSYVGFTLYNSDHTLFKSVSVPQFPGKKCGQVAYVTQGLFHTDTLIEYIAT